MRLNIHRCDRCGAEFNFDDVKGEYPVKLNNDRVMSVISIRLRSEYNYSNFTDEHNDEIQIELCPYCMEELLTTICIDTKKDIYLADRFDKAHGIKNKYER